MRHIKTYEQIFLFEELEQDLYAEECNEGLKTCYVCRESYPVEYFPFSHGPQLKKWRRRDCKFCLEKNAAIRAALSKEHPYPDDDYTCPICLEGKVHSITGVERKWNLDHCHDTSTFRGFLCSSCNKALGFFEEDIKVFKRIIKYLKNHREKTHEERKE